MSIFSLAFNEILYRPLLNGLIFLYSTIPFHDFGLSIVLLTLVIRLILYPLNQKAIQSQKKLAEFQPQLKAIQAKFKNDRPAQSRALMELYKKNKINPASGCLPLLVQLPVLIALYQVFWHGLDPKSLEALYSFVPRPDTISPLFFGFLDLSKSNFLMAILAGALTFWQAKIMPSLAGNQKSSASDFQTVLNKQMVYLMPLMIVLVSWKLPAGLALYLIATTLFGIGQQYLILGKKNGTQPPSTN